MTKITKIEIFSLVAKFKKPFSFSGITRTSSKNIIIKINTDEGVYGIGEACPVPGMSGETSASICSVIREFIAPLLSGADPLQISVLTSKIDKAVGGNVVAKAGINIALYDLAGKLLGVPVYTLLGGKFRDYVDINGSVGLGTADEMTATAEEQMEEAGVRYIKLYCGRDDVDKDVKKLKEIIRRIGGRARVFLDVNQQWTPKAAIQAIRALEEENLLYVEQPTPKWDYAGMRQVCEAVETPIAADEAVVYTTDITNLALHRAADIITIYALKPGGVKKGYESIMLSAALGMECFIGSYLELGVGTAAGIHLSAAIPSLKYPCYMFGPLKYEFDVLKEDLEIKDGRVKVPDGPGLGIDIDEDRLRLMMVE